MLFRSYCSSGSNMHVTFLTCREISTALLCVLKNSYAIGQDGYLLYLYSAFACYKRNNIKYKYWNRVKEAQRSKNAQHLERGLDGHHIFCDRIKWSSLQCSRIKPKHKPANPSSTAHKSEEQKHQIPLNSKQSPFSCLNFKNTVVTIVKLLLEEIQMLAAFLETRYPLNWVSTGCWIYHFTVMDHNPCSRK